MVNVTFCNVGRDNNTFSVKMKNLSFPELIDAVRKNGGLCSRNIDIEMIDHARGVVLAGVRIVGEFLVDGEDE